MKQQQGNSTTDGGRLDGSVQKTTLAAAHFAIGVGWGGTATFEVGAGSTDQRGTITITASATTPAQATATVAMTFADGEYASKPFALVQLINNDNAVTTAQPQSQVVTTTGLSWVAAVLPVATKIYTFGWVVIA